MSFPFLSPEWMAAARQLREQYAGTIPALPVEIRMNVVVTDVPDAAAPVHLHLDTTGGSLGLDEGHVDGPDLTITTDWSTAKALFVERDQAAVMQAFLGGQLKIQGDLMKLMAMQANMPTDDTSRELADAIEGITA